MNSRQRNRTLSENLSHCMRICKFDNFSEADVFWKNGKLVVSEWCKKLKMEGLIPFTMTLVSS